MSVQIRTRRLLGDALPHDPGLPVLNLKPSSRTIAATCRAKLLIDRANRSSPEKTRSSA